MNIEIVKAAYQSARDKAEDDIDQTKRYYQGQRDALEWIYLMMLNEEANLEEDEDAPEESAATAAEKTKKEPPEVKIFERQCIKCGRTFLTKSKNQTICPDCKAGRKREKADTRMVKQNPASSKDFIAEENKTAQKETNDALEKAARVQKATGKSYGQQQAEKYLSEQ